MYRGGGGRPQRQGRRTHREVRHERGADRDPVGDRVVAVYAPYALDKAGLLATIAGALRCRSVRRKQWVGDGYAYTMHLFGFSSDLERAELLYTSLLVQASYGMAAAQVPEWESAAAFRRSWLHGFTHAVSKRLTRAERDASSHADAARSGPSVALVLAGRRDVSPAAGVVAAAATGQRSAGRVRRGGAGRSQRGPFGSPDTGGPHGSLASLTQVDVIVG